MSTVRHAATALLFACLFAPWGGGPRAEFVLQESFDTLQQGPIDGQNGWTAPSVHSAVVADPLDPDNQVLQVLPESTYLFKAMHIPDDSVRMLFFRFRCETQLNASFGMSSLAHPTRIDHFKPELSVDNSSYALRINDGGTYTVIADLEPGLWYNCWMLLDNELDASTLWLHSRYSDDALPDDRIEVEGQTTFSFRNEAPGDLVTLFIKTGGGSGLDGPLLFDDFNIEDSNALNLTNPMPEPMSVPPRGVGSALQTLRVFPSPGIDQVTVTFVLEQSARCVLTIVNAAGATVAKLMDMELPAGTHEAVWDGRDPANRPVAAGAYRARLHTKDGEVGKSLILLRSR